MRQLLKLHPGSRCAAATRIEVDVERPHPARLLLCYAVTGKIADLRMPPPAKVERADALWQHTCFEAFVRASSSVEYYEFNFAPSTRWAVYRFGSYRDRMSVAEEIAPPRIDVHCGNDFFQLEAALELGGTPGLPAGSPWRLGLSAVIEETSERKSYWALAHPPGKADFHHADAFVLELPEGWGR
jgi:hypothetical protein